MEREKLREKLVEELEKSLNDSCDHLVLTAFQLLEPIARRSYLDEILEDPEPKTTTQVAKDYCMKPKEFLELLEKQKYMFKLGNVGYLMAGHYKNYGYTRTKSFRKKDGSMGIRTLWTQKGRLFLYCSLRDDLLKLPIGDTVGG